MSSTIQSFLNDEKNIGGILTVKLIKKVAPGTYIIGDDSMSAILDTTDEPSHDRLLHSGNWYKLIKCQKISQTKLKTNRSFKPIKARITKEIREDKGKIEDLEKSLQVAAKSKTYETIDHISTLPNH